MSGGLVVVSALLVALEVYLFVSYGGPIITACLVFTVLMFVWTLVMAVLS